MRKKKAISKAEATKILLEIAKLILEIVLLTISILQILGA